MTNEEKALSYYKAGMQQVGDTDWSRPPYVPERIVLFRTVRGDSPGSETVASPGEYTCECNQYGAVSVKADNGDMLGLRPNEFEVLSWRDNPHLEKESHKHPIRHVVIAVKDDVRLSGLEIQINRSLYGARVHTYPLTPKNYWRAVGMQLRLAGFAGGKESQMEPRTLFAELDRLVQAGKAQAPPSPVMHEIGEAEYRRRADIRNTLYDLDTVLRRIRFSPHVIEFLESVEKEPTP